MIGKKIVSFASGSIVDPRVAEILNDMDINQYTGNELPAK
jgi:hypothetical protein